MCLYPRFTYNGRYKENQKNGGIIPPVLDIRTKIVPIGCGDCMECRKQRGREWLIRLLEDIKIHTNGKFVTLTFSNESYTELLEEVQQQQFIKSTELNTELQKPNSKADSKQYRSLQRKINKCNAKISGYALDNAICTLAIRRFTERWRKQHKKAPRHWFITELGHNGTEHVHLHGIIWTNEDIVNTNKLSKIWQYGFVWTGKRTPSGRLHNYVSERTIKYAVKYFTKMDMQHKAYRSIVLSSKGIGADFLNTPRAKEHRYKDTETREYYRTPTGHKLAMPKYYRMKMYTDEQREKLWINLLNKETRYVGGEKIDVSGGDYTEYFNLLEHYRRRNIKLGYNPGGVSWQRAEYEHKIRVLKQKQRIQGSAGVNQKEMDLY